MAIRSLVVLLACLLVSAHAASVTSIYNSLRNNAVLRCGNGCDKSYIKFVFNYLLFACQWGSCKKDVVLRVTALGSASYIHEYCVVSEKFHSSKYSMRIQVDLIPQGARFVVVAVPTSNVLEAEKFTRPFILGQTVPRSQLYLVNAFVKKYCKTTN